MKDEYIFNRVPYSSHYNFSVLQGEVCSMISKKYSEFLPSMQSAQDLVTQVDKLSDDIDQLKSRIESEVRIVILVGL